MTLNCLLSADDVAISYFTVDAAGSSAMQAARMEWDAQAAEDWSEATFSPTEHKRRKAQPDACPNKCRCIATPIRPLELEDVEPGAVALTVYVLEPSGLGLDSERSQSIGYPTLLWLRRGASDIITRRYEINRYRRPGKSNRSADLGGPKQNAGVLYVLTIKVPSNSAC